MAIFLPQLPKEKVLEPFSQDRGQVQRSAQIPAKDTDENKALLVRMLLVQSPPNADEVSWRARTERCPSVGEKRRKKKTEEKTRV